MKKYGIERSFPRLFAMALIASLLVGSGLSRLHAAQPRVLMGHKSTRSCKLLVAFSPDSKTLASASTFGEGTVRLWDVQTGKTRIELKPIDAMPWAKNISKKRWADQMRGPLADMLKSVNIKHLFFSDDGETLVVFCGFPYHALVLYETATGRVRQSIRVDANEEEARAAFARRPGNVRQTYGKPIDMTGFGMGGGICRYADLSPDGKYVAAGGAGFEADLVKVWDTQGRLLCTMPGHHGRTGREYGFAGVAGVAFVNRANNTVPPSTRRSTSSRDKPSPEKVSFKADSVYQTNSNDFALVSVDFMDNIRLWDLRGRKIGEWNLKKYFPRRRSKRSVSPERFMAISPDRKTLAIGGLRGTGRVCLWDVDQCKVTRVFEGTEGSYGYTLSAFLADGTKPIWTNGQGTSVWDLEKDKRIDAVRKQERNCIPVALSPDKRTLATIGGFGETARSPLKNIRLWDLQTEANRIEAEH